MKREVNKLTNNTFYIDMKEYFGEDSIKEIAKRGQLQGEELNQFLFEKLYREFKMFLASKMMKQATFDKNEYCTQILIIEYNELTWLIKVKHHQHLQRFYKDKYGNWHNSLPFGCGKYGIVEEEDRMVIDTYTEQLNLEIVESEDY